MTAVTLPMLLPGAVVTVPERPWASAFVTDVQRAASIASNCEREDVRTKAVKDRKPR
jgi:hypothetical protein